MSEAVSEALPIPVTILTGFLGAGKTTLLNHLLANSADEKIAIVENEFGAIGIDGGLINQRSGVEVIELTNGCVCCSVRGELTAALHDLLARREQGELAFERIILETTGLADPAPIIQTFFVDEQLRERLLLDAVVTLVDCEHAQQQLDEHRVAVSQVGFADRLLLSKSDRISDEAKQQLIDRLRKINARAVCLDVDHGEISRDCWLNVQAFNLSESLNIDKAFIKSIMPITKSADYLSSNLVKKSETLLSQSWNDDISSCVFEGLEMNIKRVGEFVEQTIELYGNDMLRYKGIIAIAGEPRKLIVQGVHRVVGFDYGADWLPEEKRQTVMIIIGRNLPFEQLKQQFAQAQC